MLGNRDLSHCSWVLLVAQPAGTGSDAGTVQPSWEWGTQALCLNQGQHQRATAVSMPAILTSLPQECSPIPSHIFPARMVPASS